MAKLKKHYCVATGATITKLSQKVNEYLQQGYEPHGSAYYSGSFHYQPMIFTTNQGIQVMS